MKDYTVAQRLLLALGVDPLTVEAHRKEGADRFGRTPNFTKKGPGRFHQQGKPVVQRPPAETQL